MKALPELGALRDPNPGEKEGVLISLLIPARNSGDALRKTAKESSDFLRKLAGTSFEIILIPNPANSHDRSLEIASDIAKEIFGVRVIHHRGVRGKGAALRTGFLESRGKVIYFTDADLPYDLSFLEESYRELENGADFVSGNRRLPESWFDVPVDLLHLAYKRHRLGLQFNRVARLILPFTTTDTQAGIKGMTRKLAVAAFSKQTCPGFFFDIEFFLTAARGGFKTAELPVTLYLNSEKSTVRVVRESILAGYWLIRIFWQNLFGRYGRHSPLRASASQVLKLYRRVPALSLGTRFFLFARWHLTPYREMAKELPRKGAILDLGCGHGLFSMAAALASPSRKVTAIDHDEKRIDSARLAGDGISNLDFSIGNFTTPFGSGASRYAGIAMIDVMHYFDREFQQETAARAYKALERGGKLIVREVDPEAGAISKWNRLYEKLATKTGFTKSSNETQHAFRSRKDWERLFTEAGFQVRSKRCSSPLFADILFTCERPK
jgi:dolichyl-phosphate beta-glucosyltransferase